MRLCKNYLKRKALHEIVRREYAEGTATLDDLAEACDALTSTFTFVKIITGETIKMREAFRR